MSALFDATCTVKQVVRHDVTRFIHVTLRRARVHSLPPATMLCGPRAREPVTSAYTPATQTLVLAFPQGRPPDKAGRRTRPAAGQGRRPDRHACVVAASCADTGEPHGTAAEECAREERHTCGLAHDEFTRPCMCPCADGSMGPWATGPWATGTAAADVFLRENPPTAGPVRVRSASWLPPPPPPPLPPPPLPRLGRPRAARVIRRRRR